MSRIIRIKNPWCALLFMPLACGALEMQPWFCDIYEFHFVGSYAYSHFKTVQGARPQLREPFNANVLSLGLEFCPSPEWSIETDLQFADTSAMSFNFRTFALQGRYLWCDDIVGDPVSFATGFSTRITSTRALRDVSCSAHANCDFEVNFSLGKEFDANESWRWRLWGFGALGHGNRGSPWVRALIMGETNINDVHRWALYAIASNGYGRHSHLDPYHFFGYAKIRQKSIDLGIRYGFRTGVWGSWRFEYQRRILAKACPQSVNTAIVSYLLPFSF